MLPFLLQAEVPLFVNRLNTEESVIPYEYHHFDFCQVDESDSPMENLGQVVFGERIRPGPYKINFLEKVQCAKVMFPESLQIPIKNCHCFLFYNYLLVIC